ncbi:hypothetical protein QZH41_005314 [Actinostola sp. cb2023]|nr:hypothetical protein QZH41_005314 [Actinostola sp. cb2023]
MLALFVIFAGVCSLGIAQHNTIYFRVEEEQSPKAFVGDVSQTDFPNRLKKGGFKIRYAIQDPTQMIFTIDADTGILRTNQVLDRENLPSSARGDVFQIQILVSDKSGSLTVISPTEIRILDINDNDPKFPKDFEALRISESAPINSRFQLTSATDADIGNNSIQGFRIISGNEDEMFRLLLLKPSPNVMYLYLVNVKRLDRETRAFYHLVIAAVDGGTPLPRSGRMELNITILDSNDHSPQFSTFNFVGKVRENSPNGTYVVRVMATDKDIGTNGEIRYSLDPLPEYQGLFRIHAKSGKVWTNAPLDYEYKSKYVLSVSAQDLGPDSIPSKASITVEVSGGVTFFIK